MDGANQLKWGDLPICVFLFNVDSEQGFYRWLYEPVITSSDHAELRFNLETKPPQHPGNGSRGGVAETSFETLDDGAIDTIVHRVVRRYEARDRSRSS
jgi:hypothetical protein